MVHLVGVPSLLLQLLTMQPYLFLGFTTPRCYLDDIGDHDLSLKFLTDRGTGVTSVPLEVAIATGD
jgi:hypothetical protein